MKTIELKKKTILTISKKGNKEIKFQDEESDLIYEGTYDLEDISGFEDQKMLLNLLKKIWYQLKKVIMMK